MTVRSPSVSQFPFAEVSAVAVRQAGTFDAVINPEWTIAGKPNGGYLLAMLGRAAASVSPHDDVIAASAHYLHAPTPGAVVIEAEPLRDGRSASQIRARLSQDGQACIEALLTTSELDPDTAPYWDGGLPEISEVAYEDCDRLVPQLPDGSRVAIMDQIEVRLEPDSSGFTTDAPSGRGELRGWLALPEDEAFDPTSLLFAVDAFPPATFDIEFSGWVPTVGDASSLTAASSPASASADHSTNPECRGTSSAAVESAARLANQRPSRRSWYPENERRRTGGIAEEVLARAPQAGPRS